MKIKTKDGRLGIFVKKIKGKEIVIFSIISDGFLIEELHITMSKKKAIRFLNKTLKEIKRRKEMRTNVHSD